MSVPKISASQISTYLECPAKVAFDKINRIERQESPSAALGTATHAEVEAYFRDGTTPTSPLAMALLQNLPARIESDLEVEKSFNFLWASVGAQVNGYIDLLWLRPWAPEVHDHKTTSSIVKYAKTPEDLATDPQAVFYSLHAALAHNDRYGEMPREVTVQLGYVETALRKTKLPQTRPVRRVFTPDTIEIGLKALEPAGHGLVRIHSKRIRGEDAETNTGSCFRYGRCHYADSCPAFQNRPRDVPKEEPMTAPSEDLLARLKALSGQVVSVTNSTPQAYSPPITPPPPAAPPITPEPTLQPFDASGIDDSVRVSVKPPDARPDVSPEDPPTPPLKPSRAKGAKAARAKADETVTPSSGNVFMDLGVETPADRKKKADDLVAAYVSSKEIPRFTPPIYDEVFAAGVAAMDADEEPSAFAGGTTILPYGPETQAAAKAFLEAVASGDEIRLDSAAAKAVSAAVREANGADDPIRVLKTALQGADLTASLLIQSGFRTLAMVFLDVATDVEAKIKELNAE